MKKILSLIALIVVVVSLVLYFINSASEVINPLKIGVILPLTGPAQTAGEASQKAVELALADLPAEIRSKIQIIYEDDQLDSKLTVAAAQKLINTDKVQALITYSSGSSVAASYIAEQNQIPMIGLGNSSDINTNKKWVVRYVPSSEKLIQALEKLILKDRYKKVAIIWNQSDGPKANADQTVKLLPPAGYTIVANESVIKGEKDFKTSISKLRAANPDVVISYLSPQVGIFAKQAQDLGWNVPLIGIINFESADQVSAANGALDNQLYVGNKNSHFLDKYHAKHTMYPATAGDNLYDAVTQLAIALSQDSSNTSVMRHLRNDFIGISGAYTYQEDGSYDLEQVVKTWNGSKFIEVR